MFKKLNPLLTWNGRKRLVKKKTFMRLCFVLLKERGNVYFALLLLMECGLS